MSSAADQTAAFLTLLAQSQLVGPAQMQLLSDWAARSRPDAPALAKEINRRGWLTPYQIKEIFRGRGRGLIFGQYVLLDLLGEGGMGRVFKAHQTRLGRDVALKIIRKEKLKHPTAAARFDQEVKALGKLGKHPHVVEAFDAQQEGDTHFVVMEFIDGTDLTRLIRGHGPLAVPAACEYIRQAALGLQHAFEHGLVHRDVKPSNLLVTRDGRQVKVVDLGLAMPDEPPGGAGGHRITQEGFVLGTPDFLAPEQARDPTTVDIRADIYALGATLFYILTGKVPYEGATPAEKLVKHCTDPPPSLRRFRPDAPPQLEQLINWCMAKRPEDRPQTPLQLAHALQPFCPPGVARPGPQPAYAPAAPTQVPAAARASVVSVPASEVPASSRSSQVFRLPAQRNDADPIRRRARGGFPVGYVLVALGALSVAGVFAFAAYLVFARRDTVPPLEPFTNSVGMKLVMIEGGTFRMGSPDDETGRGADEGPVREVTIAGPFLMSATEVTHNHYIRVVGAAPPQSVGPRKAANASEHPAESVTYEDAVAFCQKLTEKEKDQPHARPGWAYRLPTEAEWEYCCRAGTDTPFWNGSSLLNRRQALYLPTGEETELPLEGGSTPGQQQDIPNKVAQFEPNPWGLYDMHGNVAEWCLDWYRPRYPAEPQDNPLGPASGGGRVVRGGSYKDPASACRSAARRGVRPDQRHDWLGFRVVYAPVLK
jgi:formylglycine-generating enzyme required for sulfatase activity